MNKALISLNLKKKIKKEMTEMFLQLEEHIISKA